MLCKIEDCQENAGLGSLISFVPAHHHPSPMKTNQEQTYTPLRDLSLQLILSMFFFFFYVIPFFLVFCVFCFVCFKRQGFTLWTQAGLKLTVWPNLASNLQWFFHPSLPCIYKNHHAQFSSVWIYQIFRTAFSVVYGIMTSILVGGTIIFWCLPYCYKGDLCLLFLTLPSDLQSPNSDCLHDFVIG